MACTLALEWTMAGKPTSCILVAFAIDEDFCGLFGSPAG